MLSLVKTSRFRRADPGTLHAHVRGVRVRWLAKAAAALTVSSRGVGADKPAVHDHVDVRNGQVVHLRSDGALVKLMSGDVGVLRTIDISLATPLEQLDPRRIFHKGQSVTVLVDKVGEAEKTDKLPLSTKWLENVPGEMLQNMEEVFRNAESTAQKRLLNSQSLKLGAVLDGTVLDVREDYAIVDVGCLSFNAILHRSSLMFGEVTDAREHVSAGMKVTVLVTRVEYTPAADSSHKVPSTVFVSMKLLDPTSPINMASQHHLPADIGFYRAQTQAHALKPGLIYTQAKVVAVRAREIEVDVGALMTGNLTAEEAGYLDAKHMSSLYTVGETVDVILVHVNHKKQQLYFSRLHTRPLPSFLTQQGSGSGTGSIAIARARSACHQTIVKEHSTCMGAVVHVTEKRALLDIGCMAYAVLPADPRFVSTTPGSEAGLTAKLEPGQQVKVRIYQVQNGRPVLNTNMLTQTLQRPLDLGPLDPNERQPNVRGWNGLVFTRSQVDKYLQRGCLCHASVLRATAEGIWVDIGGTRYAFMSTRHRETTGTSNRGSGSDGSGSDADDTAARNASTRRAASQAAKTHNPRRGSTRGTHNSADTSLHEDVAASMRAFSPGDKLYVQVESLQTDIVYVSCHSNFFQIQEKLNAVFNTARTVSAGVVESQEDISQLLEGVLREGMVAAVWKTGALVELDGSNGAAGALGVIRRFEYTSELNVARTLDLRKELAVGERVRGVLNGRVHAFMGHAKSRFMSMARLERTPGDMLSKKAEIMNGPTLKELKEGAVVSGVVESVNGSEVMVRVLGGHLGKMDVHQISDDETAERSKKLEVFEVGEVIRVMITTKHKGVSLKFSTAKLECKPGDILVDKAEVFRNAEKLEMEFLYKLRMSRKNPST